MIAPNERPLVVSSRNQYIKLLEDLESNHFITNEKLRKSYASKAFKLVTEYDRDISDYFNDFNCFVTDLSGHKKTTDKINLNFPPGWC